jgi:hypothetical protein
MAEITLQRWAQRRYGEDTPHDNTLRRWARDGYIYPVPRKQGRAYYVQEDAVYLKPGDTPPPELLRPQQAPRGNLVRKLMDAGKTA